MILLFRGFYSEIHEIQIQTAELDPCKDLEERWLFFQLLGNLLSYRFIQAAKVGSTQILAIVWST